ncbi:uncharacterized protein [Diabrotica undecimpunctata]|uniref:uncharacterized protein n=1 Tax=Diabrotica undecimpunctata TaxID=50387 RepID=UPI003B641E4D
MCDPFPIYKYFEILKNTLVELDPNDKPKQIWNLDETSLCVDPSRVKVLGAKGKSCSRTTSSPGKENVTILSAANAFGDKVPPCIVFKGKFVWDQWMATQDPDNLDIAYAATPNGWMETDVFVNFLKNTSLYAVGQQRPLLLIYDGHSTHVNTKVIELARENEITILKLPPHTSPTFSEHVRDVWYGTKPEIIQSGFRKAAIFP